MDIEIFHPQVELFAEVARCLRDGAKGSSILPLDETLDILETMDRVRAQWGLVYPGE